MMDEGQVAGEHDAAAFAALGQERKQHFHLVAVVLDVADVVENERVVFGQALEEPSSSVRTCWYTSGVARCGPRRKPQRQARPVTA